MRIIAHRSGPGLYPEQSIQSAREALRNGAEIVEMDVRETKDGALVICHDDSTQRMFGVPGVVGETTLAQFMAMRHVSDRSYAPHMLEDVFACQVRPLLLHCKQSGPAFMKKLCTTIAEYDMQKWVTLGIQHVDDAQYVRKASQEIKILAFMPSVAQLQDFAALDIDFIRLWEDWLSQDRVEEIQRAGKQVWVMTNNPACGGCGYTTPEQIRLFAQMGIHGVLVNDIPWIMSLER